MNRLVFQAAGAVGIVLSGLLLGCADKKLDVVVHQVSPDGVGPEIGRVLISQAHQGVKFAPNLHNLSPGEHGFHIHENPSCQPGEKGGVKLAALAAGGHYDPDNTGRHEGPEGYGHKGDLPRLVVDKKGYALTAVRAPRLTLNDLKGRSLMIHAGGDNYSDNPPMGGGGARIACGVIE